jgi:hypothetical protein
MIKIEASKYQWISPLLFIIVAILGLIGKSVNEGLFWVWIVLLIFNIAYTIYGILCHRKYIVVERQRTQNS